MAPLELLRALGSDPWQAKGRLALCFHYKGLGGLQALTREVQQEASGQG